MIHRRSFLTGLAVALAAPAIIRTSGLLMPVKPIFMPDFDMEAMYVRATERWYRSGITSLNTFVPLELTEANMLQALENMRLMRTIEAQVVSNSAWLCRESV